MTTPVTQTNAPIPSMSALSETERAEHAIFVLKRAKNALCDNCLVKFLPAIRSDLDLAIMILRGLSWSEDYILSRRGENHD